MDGFSRGHAMSDSLPIEPASLAPARIPETARAMGDSLTSPSAKGHRLNCFCAAFSFRVAPLWAIFGQPIASKLGHPVFQLLGFEHFWISA